MEDNAAIVLIAIVIAVILFGFSSCTQKTDCVRMMLAQNKYTADEIAKVCVQTKEEK